MNEEKWDLGDYVEAGMILVGKPLGVAAFWLLVGPVVLPFALIGLIARRFGAEKPDPPMDFM